MNADYVVTYDTAKRATMVYAGENAVAQVPDVSENASVFRAISSQYAGPSGPPGTFALGGKNLGQLIEKLKAEFPVQAEESVS